MMLLVRLGHTTSFVGLLSFWAFRGDVEGMKDEGSRMRDCEL